MQYRLDKGAGTQLSVLGFGCMRLPKGLGGIDMNKSDALIMRAIEGGVNYFDTAYLYPGSEAALGKILERNQARARVNIATKLPIGSCRKPDDFDRFFMEQQERLITKHADYYLLHNVSSFVQWQALCGLGIRDFISNRKKSGEIRRIGFSFHGPLVEFSKVLDDYNWDFCQIQYNYSDENYQAGVTGLKKAAQRGIPVIIMEPLLGGALANDLPKRAREVFERENPSLTPAAWGLRWLLDQPEVTVILSGMNREEQLLDNLKTAAESAPGMLTAQERATYQAVLQILRETDKVPCTGCGYCMPCPHGVNIPGSFAAYNASYALGAMTGMMQYLVGTAANRAENHMASRCVGCGVCEKHCPQGIAIPKNLKAVQKRMEPFYLRAALPLVRRLSK